MPFIGEFECKLDSKGRLKLPTQLVRQMGRDGIYNFVLTRGFDKNLMLYEKHVWDKIVGELEGLNLYDSKERKFLRYFFRVASMLTMDSADRILISKRQLEFAGIGQEVVLTPLKDRIEIWSKDAYNEMVASEPEDPSKLVDDVLGRNQKGNHSEHDLS